MEKTTKMLIVLSAPYGEQKENMGIRLESGTLAALYLF